MRFASDFCDPGAAKALLAGIARVADAIGVTRERPVHIMEICGGHTHSIFRHGLDRLIHPGVEFIHGPGCPVCVMPRARVDECSEIANRPRVIFTTFGDAMRVPGTRQSLLQAKAEGADIRMVDSPLDGFIGPGHVSMVIGIHPYDFIARDYGKPLVVAGFEPTDPLQSVLMVLRQIAEGRAEIENQDARVVPEHGNPVSLAAIADVYERRPGFEWRGLGEIDASGLRIRPHDAAFDAKEKFGIGYATSRREVEEAEGCACGALMTGRMKPVACPQFGRSCTPEMPIGALMVSSEGACAATGSMAVRGPWPNGRRRPVAGPQSGSRDMALRDARVTLAHGGGGRAMRDLIEDVFTGAFAPPGMEDQRGWRPGRWRNPARGSPSRPTATSSARRSFPVATSARSWSAAPRRRPPA